MRRVCSLRIKVLVSIIGLLTFLGLTVAAFIKVGFSAKLAEELQKRGVSIAKHIAGNSTGAILAQDRLALKIAAYKQKNTEEDIAYIFFLGEDRRQVLAHTFGETFPVELLGLNDVPPGEGYHVRQIVTENGPIYDVAVPIIRGGLGQVRLGMSARYVDQTVTQLSGDVLAITLTLLVLGALIAVPLSGAITRPIRQLTRAAEAIAGGDLTQQVPTAGRDEIGMLACSFNRMSQNLNRTRNELLGSNRELAEEVERRQRAEGRLAAQLDFLTTLLDELPNPVFFKDTRGRYLGCNRGFEEFLGRDKTDIIGKTVFDLRPDKQSARHHQEDQALFQAPGTRSYEAETMRRDGMLRTVVFNKATFRDNDGNLAGLVGVMVDVTAEREVARLKSEFVSTAAHEFQTPLATILGFAELLMSQPGFGADEQAEFLGLIYDKAESLSKMVDDLLDVSRIEAGRGLSLNKQPCALDEVVDQVLRELRSRAVSHRFELDLPKPAPVVEVDQARFAQVLENLLGNAVKYSPPGSRIRILGEMTDRRFRLRIENEGQGLNPDQLIRIFDKFYRAAPSDTTPSGTGLGLYIVKSIIESHGGTVEAQSVPGQGVSIGFSLPTAGTASVCTASSPG